MINLDIQTKIDKSTELLDEARTFFEASNYDESERCASEVLALIEPFAERDDLGEELDKTSQIYMIIELLAHVYNRLQTISSERLDYVLELKHADTALKFCERIGNLRRKADLLSNIGNMYRNLSDYAKALEYFQLSLSINEEISSKSGIANNLGKIGQVYSNLSDYAKALEYMQKALAIYEELGNKDGIANNLGSIGGVYEELSDYPNSLEYMQMALAIYEEIGSRSGIAVNLGNIGIVYQRLSDSAKALEYMQKALAIFEELEKKDGIANSLGNIGMLYQYLSEYAKALEYMQKALALYEELGSKSGIARNLDNIGSTYAKPDFDEYDPTKAEEFLLKAIAICEEVGIKATLYESHKNLADLYKNEKRWEECQNHFEIYHNLKEEVQSEDAKKQANLMEQRKQAAEREKTLAIERAEATATRNVLNLILPESIATRMIAGEKRIADYYQNISILFADIVGFTALATEVPPDVVVDLLNYVFDTFDEIIKRHGCEKIKTIGDGYMAVAGAPIECTDHAERIARAAIEMQQDIHLPDEIRKYLPAGTIFNIRVGIHSGAAVCGVIGRERFVWDVYSDAVNTASRMESHGEPGKIHCTEEFMQALSLSSPKSPTSPTSLHFAERGEMEIKGKGKMKTYFMEKK